MPFAGHRFTLFDKKDIKILVSNTRMRIVECRNKTENVISKIGEPVERKFTMVKLMGQ